MKPFAVLSFSSCLALVFGVLAPESLHATGAYFEEPLTSLPDFLKLDQLPAKTYRQILEETAQPMPEVEKVDVFTEAGGFKDLTGAQVLERIDKLVVRARVKRDFEALNVLNDLRDLYAGPANAAETAKYVAWRTGQPGFSKDLLGDLIKKASPALLPHYLYLRGAMVFLDHDDTESQQWFERILKEFPKHPRAEVALFMDARCQLSRSRTRNYDGTKPDLNQSQRPRAKQLLEQYLAKYPKGRWAGDALGWLGAWYYDGGNYAEALHCYLGQIDFPDHPEYAESAQNMCEKAISHLASAPKEKAWADVAKHPQAAQALVYLLLNSSESDNYNGKFDPTDQVRGWRKKLLPQVAAAIAGQEKLYQDATWRPRYLSTLALAASGTGQQDQALKLLATAGAEAETDDLLLARGVVLLRSRRPAEAIPVLRRLLEKFPDSPLARGARLRLGFALADNRQAGDAITELERMLPKPDADPAAPAPAAEEIPDATEAGEYPIYSGVADDQVRQMIDLWLNFAPIEELARPAMAPGVDPVVRLRSTEPIAQRLLAKEQFEEAKKYLTPAQFGLVAGPIEKLTKAAREAKEPAARAAACLALGDAWAAARGKLLTYPLDSEKTLLEVYPNELAYADTRRSDAAVVFGYTGNFRLDLENRDELRHAFNWWIEASDADPGKPSTATALWRALRAMPLIADVSPFAYERARTRKWDDVGRKLYDRLRTEGADTVEAKRDAVYWNFPPPPKPDPDYGNTREGAGKFLPSFQVFGLEDDESNDEAERRHLADDLAKLIADAQGEKPEIMKARMEKQLTWARGHFVGLYNARWVNLYEDLALFFSEPDPGPEVRGAYVQLRARFFEKSVIGGGYDHEGLGEDTALQKKIDAALADPKTKPVADYFEFLKLAITANHFTMVKIDVDPKDKAEEVLTKELADYRSRDYPRLARDSAAFLAKYPKSRKREAAMLLHARAVYRASAEVLVQQPSGWPTGTRWEGGYLNVAHSQEKFDEKRVLAALDEYDRDFPTGRFAADIRDYRAGVALRLHEWKTALNLTAPQLDDPKRKDLHLAAAERLCEIFRQLADERYRADLLLVIKASPRGRELLLKYLAFEADYHPLRYMSAWLREQIGEEVSFIQRL